MNSTIAEKLNVVLSDRSFYEENKNLQSHDEIIQAIQCKVPDATAEEIDQYLTLVSEQLQQDNAELSETELDAVAGGFGVTITVATVITAVKYGAAAGTVIGGALWYWKHRNC